MTYDTQETVLCERAGCPGFLAACRDHSCTRSC
jgi:hypothetical protein